MRATLLLVAVLTGALSCGLSSEQGGDLITKEQLEEMFDSIAEKTDWDMSGPMLWGYFFTSESKEPLDHVAPILESQGLRVVSIYLSDKEDLSDPDLWWLHVERVETHDPDSLHVRNLEYYQFADEQDRIEYDGMDVGPAPIRD